MYFSKTAVLSSLVSLALAADHVPVTILNFDPDFDIKCGGVTVAGRDVYNAVAWGMSLNENDEQLTSSDGNPYPSYYGNSEGFNWISDECDQAPGDARQHIPVVKGGYFEEGGAAGKYRSVYWYNYDEDIEGHPKGYYCGTIYHKSDNSFAGCDVA